MHVEFYGKMMINHDLKVPRILNKGSMAFLKEQIPTKPDCLIWSIVPLKQFPSVSLLCRNM